MSGERMSYDEVVAEISNRIREESVEAVIRFMREAGLDVTDSITALKDAGILSTNDAKLAVFKSEAWADTIEPYKEFHAALIEEVDRRGWANA